LISTMRDAGLDPGDIIADGKLHRFDVPGDRPRSLNGWYVAFDDGEFKAGRFGSWKTGENIPWCNRNKSEFSPEEKAAYRAKMEAARQARDAEQQRVYEECRAWCKDVWAHSPAATDDHPYLRRKQVQALGLRVRGDRLIVPVISNDRTIHGFQFISPDGSKKFKTGTAKLGHFHLIGKPVDNTMIICEGYATGASIHQATGHAVLVAFDAGNLLDVAKGVHGRQPSWKIIIAADDDHATDGNLGLSKATEAARAVDAMLAVPALPSSRGPKDTDFNDLARLSGSESVKRCIDAAAPVTSGPSTTPEATTRKPSLFVSVEEMFQVPVTPRFCIDGLIERDTLGELVGESGGGKTFVALDMAVAVATGGTTLNGRQAQKGLVLYLIGEGYTGSPRRIRALLEHQSREMADLAGLYFSRQAISIDAPEVREVIAEGKQLVERHGEPLGLVVVDTLARHLVGDENSATDIGAFIRELGRLQAAFPGCVVMIVHHTGHAVETKSRGRGSSAIRAALDFEILCKQGTLSFTKMKDFEAPEPIDFKLVPVQVGVDDNGEPITSCIVEYGEKSQKQQGTGLTRFEAQALEALVAVCIEENNVENKMYAGSLDAWRQEFYRLRRLEDGSPEDPAECKKQQSAFKKAFQRATGSGDQANGLQGKDVVAFTERGAVPLRLAEQDRIFNTILSSGTGDISGTSGRHVPVSAGGRDGTHSYKECPDVPPDCPPVVEVFTQEDFAEVSL